MIVVPERLIAGLMSEAVVFEAIENVFAAMARGEARNFPVIREAIGAFPQVILAEGDYVLIARQEGQVYSRDFKVESGVDRDIEVLAK